MTADNLTSHKLHTYNQLISHHKRWLTPKHPGILFIIYFFQNVILFSDIVPYNYNISVQK